MILSALSITGRAPVPETAVEFVNGVGVTIVPVCSVPGVGIPPHCVHNGDAACEGDRPGEQHLGMLMPFDRIDLVSLG